MDHPPLQSVGLDLWDYVVFVAMLCISAGIGIYYRLTGGQQKTVGEFLMGDRSMGVMPVAFSLMASFMSAITLLGVSSENYTYGTQFVVINVAYIIGTPLVAYLYLPVFYQLQVTSAYEYLERRFGKATRLLASISFQLQMVLYMGIVLYAPALALSAVSGLSKWTSIISVGLVCTFYSTIGGMKAVLITDVFQSLLMFAAIFAVCIKGCIDAGGIIDILRVAHKGQRLEFLKIDWDPTTRHTIWTQLIGGLFTYTTIYGVNQAQVQRMLTINSLRRSQMALFMSWPILTLLSLTTSFCGLVFYYVYQNCDPVLQSRLVSADQMFPLYVMDYLSAYPGVVGLCVSGIFSASLSTVSSAVNSLSAVTLEDYVKPCLSRPWSEGRQALASKFLVLAYGIACLAVAFLAEQLGGVLQASLTIFGVVGGPLLGLFSLGMFCTKSNQKGAIFGFLVGLTISCWFGFGASVYKPFNPSLLRSDDGCPVLPTNVTTSLTNFGTSANASFLATTASDHFSNHILSTPSPTNDHIFYPYRLSYMWLAPVGFFVTLFCGIFVSMITGCGAVVDPDLISPPFQWLCGVRRYTSVERKCETSASTADMESSTKLIKITTIDATSNECITKF